MKIYTPLIQLSLIGLLSFVCIQNVKGQEDDFDKFITNVYNDIKQTDCMTQDSSVNVIRGELQADGSFSSVDYDYDNNLAYIHYKKVISLINAFVCSEGTLYNDDNLYDEIVRALNYSEDNIDVQSGWYRRIGHPRERGRILILMKKAPRNLPNDLLSKIYTNMDTGYEADGTLKGAANESDIAFNHMMWAAVIKDGSKMTTNVNNVFKFLVKVSSGVGYRNDLSYLDHGKQLFISSYGMVYTGNCINVATYLANTGYAISDTYRNFISDYMLDMFIPAIRGKYIDFNAEGRSISRTNSLLKSTGVFLKSAIIDAANETKYQNVIDRITGAASPSTNVTPVAKVQYKGDFLYHVKPGFTFNVRANSVRTERTERTNDENYLGEFVSNGSTNIVVEGDEYFNIFPAWEWDKVPGVTSRDYTTDKKNTSVDGVAGKTSFVGGTSNGSVSTFTYDLNFDGVSAKKSYFAFEDEIVCLGSGITSDAAENITTALNQSWLAGNVTVKNSAGEISSMASSTEASYTNPKYVHHDQVGYFFPDNADITVSNMVQSGDWLKISPVLGATDTITGNVFKAWFSHGVKPASATYAYVVIPNISSAAMESYNPANISILANSDSVQVVRQNTSGMVQAVFYKPATLTFNDVTLKVNKPCALMLKDAETANVSTWLADPAQSSGKTELVLSNTALGSPRVLTISMPTGDFAGSTVLGEVNSETPMYVPPVPPDAKLTAIADAYVRNGTDYSTQNFGKETSLVIKQDGVGYARQVLLKFDNSGVSNNGDSVLLRMYVKSANTSIGTVKWKLYKVPDNTWTETDVTWDNQPAAGDLITEKWGMSADSYATFNVTDAARSSKSEGTQFSMLVVAENTSTDPNDTGKTDATFASRENEDPDIHPQLQLYGGSIVVYETIAKDSVITAADAYVRDGSYKNTNYGSTGTVVVKKNATGYNREGYFRFTLPAETGSGSGRVAASYPFDKVELKLWVSNSNTSVQDSKWQFYLVDDDSWGESTITWSNKPAKGELINEMQGISNGRFINVDVTDAAKAQYDGDKMLSIKVESLPTNTATSSTTDAQFSTKESTTEAQQPRLVFYETRVVSDTPLPVTLISFKATQENSAVNLAWATADEVGASHFEVQRSQNLKDWGSVAVRQAAGNSTQVQYYTAIDSLLPAKVTYYRLKMIDLDGSYTYSKIVSVKNDNKATAILYPNPLTAGETLHLSPEITSQMEGLELVNSSGIVLRRGAGMGQIQSWTRNAPMGSYILKIKLKNGEVVHKRLLISR